MKGTELMRFEPHWRVTETRREAMLERLLLYLDQYEDEVRDLQQGDADFLARRAAQDGKMMSSRMRPIGTKRYRPAKRTFKRIRPTS